MISTLTHLYLDLHSTTILGAQGSIRNEFGGGGFSLSVGVAEFGAVESNRPGSGFQTADGKRFEALSEQLEALTRAAQEASGHQRAADANVEVCAITNRRK